jgi:hypothetical protein
VHSESLSSIRFQKLPSDFLVSPVVDKGIYDIEKFLDDLLALSVHPHAVRRAVSLSAADALRLHVIDVITDDVPGPLREIDGRTVKVVGKAEQLVTAGGRQRRSDPIRSRKDDWLIQPAPTEYSQSRPPARSYPSAPDR